ncbi:hypothetical protein BHM03_00016841 [Ensete ventricosum]|nr:hypothetical protein BHM03_00016841 [Ensete ventricosum]
MCGVHAMHGSVMAGAIWLKEVSFVGLKRKPPVLRKMAKEWRRRITVNGRIVLHCHPPAIAMARASLRCTRWVSRNGL